MFFRNRSSSDKKDDAGESLLFDTDDVEMRKEEPTASSPLPAGNNVESFSSETDSLIENGSASSSSSRDTSGKPSYKKTAYCSPALFVLVLLAFQNCSKNLLMRFVMRDQPQFLTSAAVLGSECIKLILSTLYIVCFMKKSPLSILQFLRVDRRNTLLLAVPASAYNLQMSLEYVALANINAAMFSVLVQSKLLFTATFAAMVMRKKLTRIQVVSLVLLTCGVMLCNLDKSSEGSVTFAGNATKGIMATLGIALSSGFASVYTEKVIKGGGQVVKPLDENGHEYGLAYTQVQLALMSLVTIGIWAVMTDFQTIVEYGLFYNFSFGAV